jgi:hypothetical protein
MEMDGADTLAQRFEPNWNAIRQKHCLPRKGSWPPAWTNIIAATLHKQSGFYRLVGH